MAAEFPAPPPEWGLALSAEQLDKLALYAAGLREMSGRLNLVSPADLAVIETRHITDSLAGAVPLRRLVHAGGTVLDAGSGAGFPGVPLAIALPELEFTFCDSSLRRFQFLTWITSRLGLRNARALHARLGQWKGPLYSAVVQRAMGQLENILPQCLNIAAPGGYFLAWQTAAQVAADRPAAAAALTAAGGELKEDIGYPLPGEKEERHILVFARKG
ncbi:MAG TPA: 16S rRNA (guanine(527)-N(7))-methyltransferase RsmG [Elusimicrobiales bacterium]|nr:16S rRNA (guanine(527)-N(7))-methyltransferase RsmG [Elusimicrobiales bacterium]